MNVKLSKHSTNIRSKLNSLSLLFIFLFLIGCATNPVTGERQLMFTSEAKDLEIGKTQYKPAQQSQGGIYYLDPKLTAYVKNVGNKLAKVSDQPDLPYEFVILNNSVPNAWALPSGKIAINRGLLVEMDNEAQLASVLGHEIVHAAARHGAQRMRDNLLMQAGLAGLGLTLADNDYRSLIIGGASLGASLTVAKYGRDHELESDLYGMEYMAKAGYDLQGAVELQKLFVKLSGGRQSNWLQGLLASHPPSQERVQENINTASRLQPGSGFRGEAEFKQAMAYLLSKQPAYDHNDKAAKLFQDQLLSEALAEINKAIDIEPKEALFHSLKGKILEQQGKSRDALKAHDQAMSLHPDQFSYYLRRAETQKSLGKAKAAEADLAKSMTLLPTSVAALELGQLAQANGNDTKAITMYQQAASAQGNIGQLAQTKLARLEIGYAPTKYIKAKHFQDPQGPLLVFFENHSPLDVTKLQIASELYDQNGKLIKRELWDVSEDIAPKSRSKYYPIPVVYHLDPQQKIKTYVTSATAK